MDFYDFIFFFVSLLFSDSIEYLYQTIKTMFDHISKHIEVHFQVSSRYFSQTRSFVSFDIQIETFWFNQNAHKCAFNSAYRLD